MGEVIRYIPLLAFVVLAYNVLAAISVDSSAPAPCSASACSRQGLHFPGQGRGDLRRPILLDGELSKATRTTNISIADHTLSLGLLLVCLVELIVVPLPAPPPSSC